VQECPGIAGDDLFLVRGIQDLGHWRPLIGLEGGRYMPPFVRPGP
jgi:hypothetical protein